MGVVDMIVLPCCSHACCHSQILVVSKLVEGGPAANSGAIGTDSQQPFVKQSWGDPVWRRIKSTPGRMYMCSLCRLRAVSYCSDEFFRMLQSLEMCFWK